MSVQAIVCCTKSIATKIIVGLALVAGLVGYFIAEFRYLRHDSDAINAAYFAFRLSMLSTVLVVNALLVRELCRTSHDTVDQHQLSNAVPTVMVVATSLVYVVVKFLASGLDFFRCYEVAAALWRLVFAYNFYVYVITGEQFRSELRALFCRCFSSPPPPPHPAAAAGGGPNRHDTRNASLAGRRQAETVI